jgi:hypothetical protein
VGRLVCGLGVGLGFAICPQYIAEISPPKWRGVLVSMFEISINLGLLCGYVANLAFETLPDSARWRSLMVLPTIPTALVYAFLLPKLPESPRWLLRDGSPGKEALARDVLVKTCGELAAGSALADIKQVLHAQLESRNVSVLVRPRISQIQAHCLFYLSAGDCCPYIAIYTTLTTLFYLSQGKRRYRRLETEQRMAGFVFRPRPAQSAPHRRGNRFLPTSQRVGGRGVLRPASVSRRGREERTLAAASRRASRGVQNDLYRGRAVLGGRVRPTRDAACIRGRGDRVPSPAVLVLGERRQRRHGVHHARGALFVHDEVRNFPNHHTPPP